jgi:8-oxo-dGTP pyrophosphatase MutT (NUDIX family)
MHPVISNIKREFEKPLPGITYQLKMAPVMRGEFITVAPPRQAGVLILIYPDNESLYTVFMKRAEYDGVHSGQISFPGGRFEEGDVSLGETALRETEEEIGISKKDVTLIGQLTPLHIPVSNIEVFPFAGYMEKKPVFFSDPFEVEYIIEAGLDYLTDPLIVQKKKMLIREIEIEVPFFNFEGHHIWGATAMILSEFLEIIRKAFPKL